MKIPVFLVVAQWALLFALGMLVIVMYRQLGRHFSKGKSKTDLGPVVGSRATGFEYTRVSDDAVQNFMPGDGRAALVAFVGPTCPACEDLVQAMNNADHAGHLTGLRSLLLITDPPSYLQISQPFRTTRLEIGRVLANATLEAYRASATPLLVAIDAAGVVRAAGPAVEIDDVKAFVGACLLPSSDKALHDLQVIGTREELDTEVDDIDKTVSDESEARMP
jgi:hypothetical protein